MVDQYYRALVNASATSLEALLEDLESRNVFVRAHNYILDFEALHLSVSDRPEARVFELAINEYRYAMYLLSCGFYRQSFSGLRLFFELALGAIHFSSQEILLRRWLNKTADIKWSVLTNADRGLFSVEFICAFNPALQPFAKQYSVLAEGAYRECSEFVHGNIQTHSANPRAISFDKILFDDWTDRAETVRLCILFAFASRYLNLIDTKKTSKLEEIMLESLGHLEPVRDSFAI